MYARHRNTILQAYAESFLIVNRFASFASIDVNGETILMALVVKIQVDLSSRMLIKKAISCLHEKCKTTFDKIPNDIHEFWLHSFDDFLQ